MEFEISEHESVGFTVDGERMDIVFMSDHFYSSLTFSPVHVRFLIQYMQHVLPEMEKHAKFGEDVDFINKNKDVLDFAHNPTLHRTPDAEG